MANWWLQVFFAHPDWPPPRSCARLVSLGWLVFLACALFGAGYFLLKTVEARYPLAFAVIVVALGAIAKKRERN